MILIPDRQTKALVQNNKSKILGNIWSSFNLDLESNNGVIRVSPRMLIVSETEFVTTITTAPCCFKRFSADGGSTYKYWTISGTRVHSTATDLMAGSFAAVGGGAPTNCDVTISDMELGFDNLYVSTASNSLYKLTSAGTWSNFTVGAADTSSFHAMTFYANLLYYVRVNNVVYSITSGDTVSSVLLTLGSTAGDPVNQIVVFRAASNRIWIGTLNIKGGNGAMHEWDGASSQVSRSYELRSKGALAGVIKDDVPWIVDAEGKLLTWNGGTFQEVARLPLTKKQLKNSVSTVNNRFIHPNGMTVDGDEILMLINNVNGDNGATIEENFASGVWAYNAKNGLYHKYPISYQADDDVVSQITDYGQNRISAAGALAVFNPVESSSASNGTFLAGAAFYTDASSTAAAVFIDDKNNTMQKYGYLVTAWIQSQNIKDTWQKIVLKYRKLLDSGDKIVFKYRTTEVAPTEASITWLDTTSFTTTTDISAYAVGDEVEIIQGMGGGMCSHITAITGSGTYTVTVDEIHRGVQAGTAKARFQKWVKISSVADRNTESCVTAISKSSERIQLKICMLFIGDDEVNEIGIINEGHTLML